MSVQIILKYGNGEPAVGQLAQGEVGVDLQGKSLWTYSQNEGKNIQLAGGDVNLEQLPDVDIGDGNFVTIEELAIIVGQNQADLDELEGRISTNEGNISTNAGGISANATEIGKLDGRVTALEGWQKDVDAGTKLDEAHFFAERHPLPWLDVPADATGHSSGDLAEQDGTTCAIDHKRGTLVFCAALGVPRHKVFAWMVIRMGDFPSHRCPLRMHIERAHENADLDALVPQHLRLLDLLNDHDLPVRWTKNLSLLRHWKSLGHTEKLSDQKNVDRGQRAKQPKDPFWSPQAPAQGHHPCAEGHGQCNQSISFSVQCHVVKFGPRKCTTRAHARARRTKIHQNGPALHHGREAMRRCL